MKKLFTAFVSAVTAAASLAVYVPVHSITAHAEDEVIDGVTFTYEIYEDMAFLTGCKGYGSSLSLPETLGGAPLVSIGRGIFSGKTELTDVTFPDTLLLIEQSAFSGAGLTSLDLPDSLIYIEEYAFNNVPVKTLYIPDSVEEIGKYCFEDCTELTDLKLSAGMTFCGNGAFEDCTALVNVEIPDGCEYLGQDMFAGCSNVKEITLPGSIKPCGYRPLPPDITTLVVEEGVTYLPDNLCRGNTSLTELYLPDSVEIISPYAFAGCEQLVSFDIPKNVQTIDRHAFDGCTNLTEVNCPPTLEYIGACAFSDCYNLENINGIDNVSYIGQNAFEDTAFIDSYINNMDNMIVLGDSVLYLYQARSSEELNPVFTGIKYVSPNAFYDSSIQTITFADSLIAVYGQVIDSSSNDSLKEVNFPDTLEYIGEYAFRFCRSLEKVNIPDSVKYIGREAFRDTKFDANLSGEFVILGDGYLYKYNYTGTETEIVVPDGVKVIGCNSVFSVSATSLVLPDTVERINSWGIQMNKLESLVIPDSVKIIDSNAVLCSKLYDLDLGEGVEYIGENAFCCGGSYVDGEFVHNDLHIVQLPNSLKEIETSFGYYLNQGQYDWYNRIYLRRTDVFAIAAEWGSVGAEYAQQNDIPLLYVVEGDAGEFYLGDVDGNGAVEIADMVLLQSYLMSRTGLEQDQAMRADINCDNTVDAYDMIYMRELVVNWSTVAASN